MATIDQKVSDADWVRQAFLVPKTALADIDNRNRSFSSASFKFGNTTLGGSLAINSPAQFTPNCDIRVPGLFIARDPTTGAPLGYNNHGSYGRYYSEAIDDNNRIISMRFGVPKFNSLSTFFTGFYNPEAGVLARTGRGTGVLYSIGVAAGYVVPLFSFPLLAFSLAGNILRFLTHKPSSKYYFLKPAMPLYWNAVQSMVNAIGVNKGMVPRALIGTEMGTYLDERYPFTAENMTEFKNLMPDILYDSGQINVYAMATKYQRQARHMYKYMEQAYSSKDETGAAQPVPTDPSDVMNDVLKRGFRMSDIKNNSPSIKNYVKAWFDSTPGRPSASAGAAQTTPDATKANPDATPPVDTEGTYKNDADLDGFEKFLAAELDDGSSFVSFRVDNDGPVHESFSSQTGESEIANKINSMSGQARETNFNFSGGNLSDGVLGTAAGAVIGGVKDFLAGVGKGIGMSGLAALGGSAFVDIPKHWVASSASLPSMSYSFQLTSPYGNKISQMFNLYVPLCMILAAALPLSTGKQSYTSPFLVELYDRGRAQTRLGIIDSISIQRGTGNQGFNNAGSAMAIDVSFTVQDLSSILHMPIIQGFDLTAPFQGLFDDDTVFTDYMAILGSLTLNEQQYAGERLKLNLTRKMQNMNSWFSTAHTAQWIGDLAPLQLVSAFMAGRVNR